ncbi:hypothetical protein AURDEDRAFT_177408 [Auricularia subglabra TFB-10046 SS5]|uniref:F-box domain-containing protein n=1 Tax=Auricularia subglabra (strain TFB-10046 / SS5) TaxID=717982 RepID=J0WME2_AURST|nr:hypothetical protein AURDEDRAFT_177408 [Auricularia subglabra TFB-10046 SS5]
MGTLAGLLRRAGNSPVDVHVTHISFFDLHEIVRILGDHIYHIRTLALYTSAPKLDHFHIHVVYGLFEKPAPLLEVVDIQLFSRSFFEDCLKIDALQDPSLRLPPPLLRQAPKLRQLSFQTMTFPQTAGDGFLAVTRLEIDGVFLSADQMSAIVSLPCLRNLHLEIAGCALPNAQPPPTFRLDELWLYGMWQTRESIPDMLPSALQYLGFPHIPHFITDNWDVLDLVLSSLSHRSTLLVDYWRDLNDPNAVTGVACRLIDHRGLIFDLVGILFVVAPFDLDLCILANLVEIEIPYDELTGVQSDFDLPKLERLCLRVRAGETARWKPERLLEGRISCPNLHTVELWNYPEHSTVSMASAQLLHFISHLLDLSPRRAVDIVLRGVAVVYSSELGLLDHVVGTVRDDVRPAPPPFGLELQTRWHASVQ